MTKILTTRRLLSLLGFASLVSCLGLDIRAIVEKAVTEALVNFDKVAHDTQNEAAAQIEDAISSLDSAAGNVTDILRDLEANLPELVDERIRGEISNLALRTVSAAGIEARCFVDFFRSRVKDELRYIKDQLLGTKSSPPPPYICQVVPLVVDLSLPETARNRIELYGFDMDKADVKVLVEGGGQPADISDRIDEPSPYAMTINLSGTPAVIKKGSTRIRVQASGGSEHTIAVLEPSTKVCKTKVDVVKSQTVSWVPPHVAGGKDFHFGSRILGPRVLVRTDLSWTDDAINARVWMRAAIDDLDTRNRLTTLGIYQPYYLLVRDARAEGAKTFQIYEPKDKGWKIVNVNAESFAGEFEREITSFKEFTSLEGEGETIRRYKVQGPYEKEPDAGTMTRVEVTFNEITVTLAEVGDHCVPPEQLAKAADRLSPETIAKFKAVLETPPTPSLKARILKRNVKRLQSGSVEPTKP